MNLWGYKSSAGLGLSLLLSACADDLRFIAYPEVPSATSFIVIPRASPSWFAMDQLLPIELPLGEVEPDLLLLSYQDALEALDLGPGSFPTPTTCRSCALLRPSTAFFREAEDDWIDLEAVVPDWAKTALVSDHEDRCSGCPAFQSERTPVPETDESTALEIARWDDETVIVQDEPTGRFFRVSSTGEVSLACATETDFDVRVIFRGQGSDLWLMETSGVVRRMDLDALDASLPCRASTSTRTPPLGAVAKALHVQSTPRGEVIHALVAPSSRVGGPAYLHRFSEGQWTLVYTFAETGGVASIAVTPDEILYAVVGGNDVVRVQDGLVTSWMPLDPAVPYEFTVLAFIPDFGLLSATRLRGLIRPGENEAWVSLDDRNVASLGRERFATIAPYGDGVLLANYQGGVHYYSAQIGYCDQIGLFGRQTGRTLTLLPNGQMFSGQDELYRAWPRADACDR